MCIQYTWSTCLGYLETYTALFEFFDFRQIANTIVGLKKPVFFRVTVFFSIFFYFLTKICSLYYQYKQGFGTGFYFMPTLNSSKYSEFRYELHFSPDERQCDENL